MGFEVTKNFKYKEYPALDIDKIDLDRVNEDLLTFIVADLGLDEEESSFEESSFEESDLRDRDVAVVEQDYEIEEVANEESGSPEAAKNDSTNLDEALDEEWDELAEAAMYEEGYFDKYPEEKYDGEEYDEEADDFVYFHLNPFDNEHTIDNTLKKVFDGRSEYMSNPGHVKYNPLIPNGGQCGAEYCVPPRDLPLAAYFAEDGFIYDIDSKGTWELEFDGEGNEWWEFYPF